MALIPDISETIPNSVHPVGVYWDVQALYHGKLFIEKTSFPPHFRPDISNPCAKRKTILGLKHYYLQPLPVTCCINSRQINSKNELLQSGEGRAIVWGLSQCRKGRFLINKIFNKPLSGSWERTAPLQSPHCCQQLNQEIIRRNNGKAVSWNSALPLH